MTVYIVTAGEYSDYQIHGVFHSKEDAQEFIDHIKRRVYNPCIEVWETGVFEAGKMVYDVIWCGRSDKWDVRPGDVVGDRTYFDPSKWGGYFHTCVVADSKERALKVASERKARAILERDSHE